MTPRGSLFGRGAFALLAGLCLSAAAPAPGLDVVYAWSGDQPARLLAHRRPDSKAYVRPGEPWLGYPPKGASPEVVRRWYSLDPIINEAAEGYGLDPALLKAVMWYESKGYQYARSGAGAEGWFQLMPKTQERLGVDDPFDGRQATWGGAAHLRGSADKFRTQNMLIMVAGFHAGDPAVARHLASMKKHGASLKNPWDAVPKITTTREAVAWALTVWDAIHRGLPCPALQKFR